MEKLCVIFGAGERVAPRRRFGKDALIIAADGGYAAARELGIEPNVVIGDFDSGEMPTDTDAHIIKLNRDKDDTDMLAAIKLGLRRECKTFVIYGGTGGRLDHTVANFSALAYLNAFDARGFLVSADAVVTVIENGTFTLPVSTRGIVSVFAYGGVASGVSEKGLKFSLDGAELTPELPLGVSNEAIGQSARISVKSGRLLIFFPRANR